MGGAVFTSGNVPPLKVAEYNIFLDPEAAEIVFSSGIKITLVATDATQYVPVTESFKKKIADKKPTTPQGQLIQKIIIANSKDFKYFYDPLAAAVLLEKRIVSRVKKVEIKTILSGLKRGLTLGIPTKKGNVSSITFLNSKLFYNMIEKTLN